MPRRAQASTRIRSTRSMEWIASFTDAAIAVAAETSAVFSMSLSTALDAYTGATIIRTRGTIGLLMIGTTGNHGLVGLGLTILPERGLAAASAPRAIDDSDYPFFWHQYVPVEIFADAADNYLWIEVDAKAMRKVPAQSEIVLMVETDSGAGSPTVEVVSALRFLIKE